MKVIQIAVVVMFSLIILTPIVTFRFEEGVISEIDNRELASNPFSEESSGDLTDNIQNYLNDRLGFRDDMILAYIVLNDKLFNIMVHPSYTYGKEGHVFGEGITVNNPFTAYHEAFADMVKKIQDYCDERGVPFLFVFTPAKPAILSEYIADGINYDRTWVEVFFAALEEKGVRYLDNTQTLREKTDEGEVVFNQKYDANHWNDLGAFYGTNAMLEILKEDIPTIHVNQIEEMTVSQTLKTSLLISKFPINEMVPTITINTQAHTYATNLYAELEMNPSYRTFGYYVNEERKEEGAPRVLVFQGSNMNSYGYKYLANAFGEYIFVHDYQNVTNFAYYYNIFQPDCVIFEVAEYTFSEPYFNSENMRAMDLNPFFGHAITENKSIETHMVDMDDFTIEQGENLTKIRWTYDEPAEYVWLCLDREYDMKKTENGYEVTVLSQTIEQYRNDMQTVAMEGDDVAIFLFRE